MCRDATAFMSFAHSGFCREVRSLPASVQCPRPQWPVCCSMQQDRRRFIQRSVMLILAHLEPCKQHALAIDDDSGPESSSAEFVRTPSGLEYRDIRVGAGRAAELGDIVRVRWTGRLADRYGWPFQRENMDVVSIRLEPDTVIQGFVQGVTGMREGGKRRLLIPRELGYFREGQEPVPADFGDRRRLYSTVLNKRRFVSAGDLLIDVELKKCKPAK